MTDQELNDMPLPPTAVNVIDNIDREIPLDPLPDPQPANKLNFRITLLGFVLVMLIASSFLAGGIITCRNSGGFMSGLKCNNLQNLSVCPYEGRYIIPVEYASTMVKHTEQLK